MSSSPCSGIVAPTGLSYFTAALSGVLSVVTMLGNLTVCFAVYKDPYGKLRTPFMYFLVNLSLSDLVVGCITMPTSVATHTMEVKGTKRKEHVDLILTTYFISATASLLSLAALCVDRYFAVAFPVKYRRNAKFKRCIMVSILIWLVSLSLPFLYYVTGYMIYLMIFAHTVVATSLFILLFSYFKIYKVLLSQKDKFSSIAVAESAPNQSPNLASRNAVEKVVKRERKVTRVFIIILSVFAACYVPVIAMIYLLMFCPNCDCTFRHVLRDLQFLLAISNSAVNPFICTLRLRPFRDALMKIFDLRQAESQSALSSSTDPGRVISNKRAGTYDVKTAEPRE